MAGISFDLWFMYFQYVSVWPTDLIVDSPPDIIDSCLVIGFGVNVLLFSMRIFMFFVLNWLILLHRKTFSDGCIVYKPRLKRIENQCTQFIKFKQVVWLTFCFLNWIVFEFLRPPQLQFESFFFFDLCFWRGVCKLVCWWRYGGRWMYRS